MSNEELAKQWIESKHWGGWRRGMVWSRPPGASFCISDGHDEHFHNVEQPDSGRLPDLDHPGTRAFLLEDVRKAWESEGPVCVVPHWKGGTLSGEPIWGVNVRRVANELWGIGGEGPSEHAALIAALAATEPGR